MFKVIAEEFTHAPNDVKSVEFPMPFTVKEVEFISKNVISELMELASTVTEDPINFVKKCCETDLPKKYTGTNELDRLAAQADALVDLTYYVGDVAARSGMNLDPIFNVVHKANASKIGPGGEVKRRLDGKIMKPEGWKEPDVLSVIKKQCSDGSWV